MKVQVKRSRISRNIHKIIKENFPHIGKEQRSQTQEWQKTWNRLSEVILTLTHNHQSLQLNIKKKTEICMQKDNLNRNTNQTHCWLLTGDIFGQKRTECHIPDPKTKKVSAQNNIPSKYFICIWKWNQNTSTASRNWKTAVTRSTLQMLLKKVKTGKTKQLHPTMAKGNFSVKTTKETKWVTLVDKIVQKICKYLEAEHATEWTTG